MTAIIISYNTLDHSNKCSEQIFIVYDSLSKDRSIQLPFNKPFAIFRS